jgi:hypothetical protein
MLIHCCILLDFFYELYCDARIHEHQVHFDSRFIYISLGLFIYAHNLNIRYFNTIFSTFCLVRYVSFARTPPNCDNTAPTTKLYGRPGYVYLSPFRSTVGLLPTLLNSTSATCC